jgi:hypothetical protein
VFKSRTKTITQVGSDVLDLILWVSANPPVWQTEANVVMIYKKVERKMKKIRVVEI